MKENNYCVYMHVFPNGKRYIGITDNTKRRWANGSGYLGQKLINQAIIKYGWANIKHQILFKNLTWEEACHKEIELIKQYNTNDIKNGYNATQGGEGTVGVKKTPEQIKILKEKLTKAKGKKIVKIVHDGHSFYNIYKFDDVEIFNSLTEASEKAKISKETISSRVRDKSNDEWKEYNDYYIEQMLKENINRDLYEYFLKKDYFPDWLVELMGGNLIFCKELAKNDKRYQKSSESPVNKVLL